MAPPPKPTLQLKFAQNEYFVGEQISGEVVLTVPATIAGVQGLEMQVWCEEVCGWTERAETISSAAARRSKTKPHKADAKCLFEGIHYHGGRLSYNVRRIVWTPSDNTVQQGTYTLPFTYYLPFKVPATTHLDGRNIQISVRHWCHARLLPAVASADLLRGQTAAAEKETILTPSKAPLSDIVRSSVLYITDCLEELTVLEKALHQATLRPYSFQCTYSVPQVLFRGGELIVSTKKSFLSFVPGEEVPLTVEILNQTQTTVTAILIVLRHTLTIKSIAGNFKDVTYPHCRWVKPVSIAGSKNATVEHITVPLLLPPTVSPTSHGSVLTNEWDILVSCRYKGKLAIAQHVTGQDVVFPICVWPGTVHPARHNGIPPRAAIFDASISPDEYGDMLAAEGCLPPPKAAVSPISQETAVTVLPTATFETSPDAGTPKVESVVTLTKMSRTQGGDTMAEPVPATPALTYHKYTDAIDMGILMSAALTRLVDLARGGATEKTVKVSAKNQPAPRVKRAIAPLQKS